MEHYKVDETVCPHPEWREDMFSRTCMVCGYNNLIEDYQTEKKEEIEKATPIGNTLFRLRGTEGMPVNMVVVGEVGIAHKIVEAMAQVNKLDFTNIDLIAPLMPIDEVAKEHIYKIIAPPEIDELVILDNTDPLKLDGTKQKKFRKGNNKKYFRRKRK